MAAKESAAGASLIRIADNSLVNPWPPVKEGVSFNALRISHEGDTLIFQGLLERLETVEGAVLDGFVTQSPKVFSGLQLRGVRGLVDDLDTFGNSVTAMPGSAVHHNQDTLMLRSGDGCRKVLEDNVESCCVQGGQQIPDRLAGLRSYKAIQVEPFVAGLNADDRALPSGCPDLAQDGFESEAVFVEGPEFNRSRHRCTCCDGFR